MSKYPAITFVILGNCNSWRKIYRLRIRLWCFNGVTSSMKTIKLVKNAKSVRCLFNGRLGFKINLVTLLGLKKVLQRYSIIYLASHRKTLFHFVQASTKDTILQNKIFLSFHSIKRDKSYLVLILTTFLLFEYTISI